ncbi:MAG TPA: RsmE family RNA methyltransferase [Gemmatimonadaceae bacterium]|nr:RsmE family RNA methyltransferase [Gemmatimonadaceae bacterium]
MVRDHRTGALMPLATFVTPDSFEQGETVTLGEDEARHIRVLRLDIGQQVGLLDGKGMRGRGALVRLAKRHAAVSVEQVSHVEPPPSVHLIVPVADRDRMLWLAEKATELAATSWRPVLFKRSKSVNPRGEGPTFQQKVAARMAGALGQSHGAWLPAAYPDATVDRAIAATPDGPKLVLDMAGEPMGLLVADAIANAREHGAGFLKPITIVVGPEGGLEASELEVFAKAGFRSVSLGLTVLRFETAAVAALAVVRTALATLPKSIRVSREELEEMRND